MYMKARDGGALSSLGLKSHRVMVAFSASMDRSARFDTIYCSYSL